MSTSVGKAGAGDMVNTATEYTRNWCGSPQGHNKYRACLEPSDLYSSSYCLLVTSSELALPEPLGCVSQYGSRRPKPSLPSLP